MPVGYALYEIIYDDQGQLNDLRYLEVNPAFERITGFVADSVLGHTLLEILPIAELNWIENFKKIALTGESVCFENYHGQCNRCIEVTAFMYAPDQIASLITDTSERARAAAAVQESQEFFRAIADSSVDAIISVDESGRITFFSYGAEKMFGYTAAEALGQPTTLLMPEDQRVLHTAAFNSYLETGQARIIGKVVEVTARRSNGEVFPVDLTLSTSLAGGKTLFSSIIRDITERKIAEEKSRENQERLASIYHTVADVIFQLEVEENEDYRFVSVNSAFNKVTGLPTEEVVGKLVNEVIPQPSLAMALGNYRRAIQKKMIVSWEETSDYPTGRLVGVVSVAPIFDDDGQCTYLVGSVHDITKRKQAELHAATHSKTMTALADGAPLTDVLSILVQGLEAEHPGTMGSVLLLDAEGTHLLTSAAPSLPGFYNEAIHGMSIGPEAGSCGTSAFRNDRVVVSDIQSDPLWTEYKTLAARAGLAACWSEPIRDSRGRVLGTLAFYYSQPREPSEAEIDAIVASAQLAALAIERKNTELALSAEREQLSVTLRSIADGVITTDTSGNVVLLNKSAEKLTGWDSHEARGQPLPEVFNIVNERTHQVSENPADRVLASGGIVKLENHTCLISRDGRKITISDSGAPIYDSNSRVIGVVIVFRDMTEKVILDRVLQQSQKLESLGVLAGGIAHDFNNILSGIFGYTEMAIAKSTEENVSTLLAESLHNIERARSLTQQLLTFAKGGTPIKKTENLFPFVQQAAQFALSGSSVSCRFQIQENLWPCDIDKNQIGQVVDNIVINAQQAMPNGGSIELSAVNISLPSEEPVSLRDGNYVKLSIKDRGIGIPIEFLPRIFDPYYTTKPQGHGLGLSTCYSIIDRHGGCIDVESEPGKGSTFHVFLPASIESTVSVADNASKNHAGTGTFLVLDDDESIRNILKRMLESFGYTVVLKQDGKDAVDFLAKERRANRKLAGMIFDLTIPGGMGGKEAIREIRKICSDIPVFVASVYSGDPIIANPEEYGFTASIGKPFLMSELSEMLEKHFKKPD